MKSKEVYRKANGRRVEGQGLAIRIAQSVKGMLLAQAFVVVRAAGMLLKVNKLDGVPMGASSSVDGKGVVSVDVIGGIVQKSWAS